MAVHKTGSYYDIKWAFASSEWAYNDDLEDAVKNESEIYKRTEMKVLGRYNLKGNDKPNK